MQPNRIHLEHSEAPEKLMMLQTTVTEQENEKIYDHLKIPRTNYYQKSMSQEQKQTSSTRIKQPQLISYLMGKIEHFFPLMLEARERCPLLSVILDTGLQVLGRSLGKIIKHKIKENICNSYIWMNFCIACVRNAYNSII